MLLPRMLAVGWALLAAGLGHAQNTTAWPLHNNGRNTVVEWDHYSFHVNGQRLFVFSGEFHYWRFPVWVERRGRGRTCPELWQDLLEKIKAAGFNAFSIYAHWGYHAPSPSTLDFATGAHDFTSILALATQLGLYVIVRPGPYVNAESNAGGYPLWATTGAYGALRDDDARYTAAWAPYWAAVAALVAPHLVTNGGTVVFFQVENEYGEQWADLATRTPDVAAGHYMAALAAAARAAGPIDVPLVHNNPNMRAYSWSTDFSGNATGNVDVVGVDSYPSCWSCDLTECTGTNGAYKAYQVVDYYDYFQDFSPSQPSFLPEFQGGSYNPWAGPEGGCPADIGADFANLFYRHLVAQRVTAVSLYMVFGGTNWGWLAFPLVGSSYDYSSPVAETRAIGAKYYETKLLAMFTRVATDLARTDRQRNGTGATGHAAVTTSELRNGETGAAFYVAMHLDSTSSTVETFQVAVDTSKGPLTVPQHGGSVTINGHQAKILPTDFRFGAKNLLYSTAEVLTYSILDGTEVLAVWLPTGESGELVVEGVASANLAKSSSSNSSSTTVRFVPGSSSVAINWANTSGITVVDLEDGARVVILDRDAAYVFWAPNLSNNPMYPVNNTILVQGPYLVRSAAIADGTLALTGDIDAAAQAITIFTTAVTSVTWNGKPLTITSRDGNMLTATLDGPPAFSLPSLGPWKSMDSLPEIQANYTASSTTWITANIRNTSHPVHPAPNNPVLYVDEYDIHFGCHIYRATFPTASQTGVYLNITGGAASGYSIWLNGVFIGSYLGGPKAATGALAFSFANATLAAAADNVLIVVMENTGHDETSGAITARGIFNATLLGPDDGSASPPPAFSAWQIAGTAGRDANIDPMRGPYNEGGLYAERVGAHLPGYPDGEWVATSNSNATATAAAAASLVVPGAGIRVFRTVVPLAVPPGLDVSVSFLLSAPGNGSSRATFASASYTNQARALLFVNGYQYGRFSPFVGNQVRFPVPPGILDYHGENTVAVTVWSQSARGAEVRVDWVLEYVHASGYDMGFDAGYLRPAWTRGRLAYA